MITDRNAKTAPPSRSQGLFKLGHSYALMLHGDSFPSDLLTFLLPAVRNLSVQADMTMRGYLYHRVASAPKSPSLLTQPDDLYPRTNQGMKVQYYYVRLRCYSGSCLFRALSHSIPSRVVACANLFRIPQQPRHCFPSLLYRLRHDAAR